MLYDKRASILELKKQGEQEWGWEEHRQVWVRVEQKAQKNLFSAVGVGTKTVLFALPPRKLVLTQAIRWKETHYHITDIDRGDPLEMRVTAADVAVTQCRALRYPEGMGTAGYRGEPEELCAFPGVLVEKWAGYRQVDQYAELKTTMVLVTPKVIDLKINDIVIQGEKEYAVRVPHKSLAHQNEYELEGGEEA